MLLRALHRRLAWLSLAAALLVVAMPTFAPVLSQAGRAPMAIGEPMHALHATPPAARANTVTQPVHPGGPGHPATHDAGDCAYCPLLAGLLPCASNATRIVGLPWRDTSHSMTSRTARASRRHDTLGARGPPAPHAA